MVMAHGIRMTSWSMSLVATVCLTAPELDKLVECGKASSHLYCGEPSILVDMRAKLTP